MTIKENHWTIRLISSTFGNWSLPQNVCVYFWKLLCAIILFPVSLFTHIVNYVFTIRREYNSIISCNFEILFRLIFLAVLVSEQHDIKHKFPFEILSLSHALTGNYCIDFYIKSTILTIIGLIWFALILAVVLFLVMLYTKATEKIESGYKKLSLKINKKEMCKKITYKKG